MSVVLQCNLSHLWSVVQSSAVSGASVGRLSLSQAPVLTLSSPSGFVCLEIERSAPPPSGDPENKHMDWRPTWKSTSICTTYITVSTLSLCYFLCVIVFKLPCVHYHLCVTVSTLSCLSYCFTVLSITFICLYIITSALSPLICVYSCHLYVGQ